MVENGQKGRHGCVKSEHVLCFKMLYRQNKKMPLTVPNLILFHSKTRMLYKTKLSQIISNGINEMKAKQNSSLVILSLSLFLFYFWTFPALELLHLGKCWLVNNNIFLLSRHKKDNNCLIRTKHTDWQLTELAHDKRVSTSFTSLS